MSQPLAGVVVADFTQLVQGPFASQILADLGADVIKIEPPAGDWLRSFALANAYPGGESISFLAFNRGKRSIALDLKHPPAVDAARRIVARSDILLENFRPGVMDRLGLGWDVVKDLNPRLIYCASTGYGRTGPYASRPGQDLLIQALTGLPWLNGRRDDPPTPVAVGIADLVSGLHMVYGALAALHARHSTGRGTRVDVNLLDSLLALQSQELVTYLHTGAAPERDAVAPGSPYVGAPFGIYATRDGFIALAMNPVNRLAATAGVTGWEHVDTTNLDDDAERFREALGAQLADRDSSEWIDVLLDAGIWCAPLNDYAGVAADPQVAANEMIVEIEHPTAGAIRVLGNPVSFNDERPVADAPPPLLGRDAQDILAEAGLSSAEIAAALKEPGR